MKPSHRETRNIYRVHSNGRKSSGKEWLKTPRKLRDFSLTEPTCRGAQLSVQGRQESAMGIPPNYTREFAGEYTGTIFRDTQPGENIGQKKRKPTERK